MFSTNLSYTNRKSTPLNRLNINLGCIPDRNLEAPSSLYTVRKQWKKPVYLGIYWVSILERQTSMGLVTRVATKLAITKRRYLT